MNQPSPVAFDYTSLERSGNADWLRKKTVRLRGYTTDVALLIVKIGLELTEVRAKLKKRTFRTWVKTELSWSITKVYTFMRVAKVFGAVARIDQFQPTALYLLCWPAAPAAARQAALVLVEDGHVVTNKKARELIATHTPIPPVPDEDAEPKPKLIVGREPKLKGQSIPERNWADLVEVAAEFSTLHITKIEDEDYEEEVHWSITAYPTDMSTGIKRVQKSDLGDAIAALLGDERTKVCAGECEEELPLSRFCVSRLDPTGRNRICRKCESVRRNAAREIARRAPQSPPA